MSTWYVKVKDGALWGIISPRYITILPKSFQTNVFPEEKVEYGKLTLHPSGLLEIAPGFNWDGASGPTVDDAQNQEPSLCHDALFRLGAKGLLPKGWFSKSNKLMRKHMLDRRDKGSGIWNRVRRVAQTARSWVYYWGLEVFGWFRFFRSG